MCAQHRLVVIGDSLSQGFMSGAIHRPDISFPVWVADALGVRDSFIRPDFSGAGGLPVNLERLLKRLSNRYGRHISWWEVLPAMATVRSLLDDTEDYWERGRGAWAYPQDATNHNLAVWGFEVRDAYTVTEGSCRRAIPEPTDNLLKQLPEMSMYRTARRVLNPTFANDTMETHQVAAAQRIAADGGIENLLVFLGANNCLGTVTSLEIRESEVADLTRLPHQRGSNLYLPEHFEQLYEKLASEVAGIGAERVFLGTVPHVTIPPATRGVSPDGTRVDGYFEFYTRPWIWDNAFDKDDDPHLTRDDARKIDRFIDQYNAVIRHTAAQNNWHVIDMCALLDDLAYRRHAGAPPYDFPTGLVDALADNSRLSYLVDDAGKVKLDTRFFKVDDGETPRIRKGGLFSLDGIHPTTVTYGLTANVAVEAMKAAGVAFAKPDVDWPAIVASDTLLNHPPALLHDLSRLLRFMEDRGILSALYGLFDRTRD